MNPTIIDLAISKAKQSVCSYKVSAIGFCKKGDLIGTAINKRHICRHGCGKHAEIELMRRYGRNLKTIIICRVNNRGDLLPIDPCPMCQKMADKLNIKIKTIKGRGNV